MVQDNLEIRGQTATVYMNDRKIQLTQTEIQELLQGLGGSAIASIEVIPNPPASFEAYYEGSKKNYGVQYKRGIISSINPTWARDDSAASTRPRSAASR